MIIKILIFILSVLILSVIFTSIFLLLIRRGFIALNELTPDIDETKEILKGNLAVSQYFGKIISSFVIGVSIILSSIIIAATSFIK